MRDDNFLLLSYALLDCYIAIIPLIFLFVEMAPDEHRVYSLSFFLVNNSVELRPIVNIKRSPTLLK